MKALTSLDPTKIAVSQLPGGGGGCCVQERCQDRIPVFKDDDSRDQQELVGVEGAHDDRGDELESLIEVLVRPRC
jgi:hypothetical protein